MRRVLIGVAAVLAVAPLAAVAPASAAVQHRAAAQTGCSNGTAVYVQNWNSSDNFAAGTYVGSWNVNTSSSVEASGSSGEVEDSYSRMTTFCESVDGGIYYVLRQQGTNLCATWDQNAAPKNTVQMETCSPSNTDAQNWLLNGADELTTALNNGKSILGGAGGDTAVYMAGDPPNNLWRLPYTDDSCIPPSCQ
jgi:hypothetical protein